MINEFGILDKTTFTSFQFDYIHKIKELNSKARVGWLVDEVTDDNITKLLDIGGDELAPRAECITEESVQKLRALHIGIRAWGVLNISLMKKMCTLQVDGMTVNFPDRLYQFLKQNK